MIWKQKIKAGALQFVLFVGAIIAVLLMAFTLLAYTHDHFHKKTTLLVDLVQAADYALANSFQKDIPLATPVRIPTNAKPAISMTVSREFWGVFEKRTAFAEFKKQAFKKIALVGRQLGDQSYGLYLKDRQRPLILAGSAKISGDALLPKQGIRPGNIAGHSYHHSQLLYGQQRESGPNLPELAIELQEHIQRLTDPGFELSGERVPYKSNIELSNSFKKETQLLRASRVVLEGAKLYGNIIVQAGQQIVVEPNSSLKDVILIAPEIIIKDGVQASFQAFASERIVVGAEATLAYPSALVVKERADMQKEGRLDLPPEIVISGRTELRGLVAFFGAKEEPTYRPQLKIEAEALVLGEVYCDKNLELKGRVLGTVFTDSFIALENGSIYQNHLYNGQIDHRALSRSYAGLLLAGEPQKTLGKWLY